MTSIPPRLREVLKELDAARKRLMDSVVSLSQADVDFSPSAERWSIGEILDHLRLIEDSAVRVLRKLADKAEKAGCGPDPGTGSVFRGLDRFRIENVVDKIAAPASVAPTKSIPGRQLVDALADSRAALMEALALCARFDLTQLSFPHPVLGRLDGYQWALYVAGHEERHRRQIENVKALRAGPS